MSAPSKGSENLALALAYVEKWQLPAPTPATDETAVAADDTLNLGERATRFKQRVLDNGRRVWPLLWSSELRTLKHHYTLKTIHASISHDYRPALAGHPALKAIKLPRSDIEAIMASNAARVETYRVDRIALREPLALLERAKSALRHKDPWHIIAALCLITGRRPVELTSYGSFQKTSPDHPLRVLFTGQAKTRSAPGTRQGAYPIHVLDDSAVVVSAHNRARTALGLVGLSYKDTRAHYASLYKAIGQIYGSDPRGNDWTPQTLRAAHACMAYAAFASEAMAPTRFYSQQLGHKLLIDAPGAASAASGPGITSAAIADSRTADFYDRFYIPTVDLLKFRRAFGFDPSKATVSRKSALAKKPRRKLSNPPVYGLVRN